MRPRALLLLPVMAAAALAGCVRDPETEANRAQQLIELGDALRDLQQQAADQAATVDSLRLVVARQDTVLRQLAGMAGVPYNR